MTIKPTTLLDEPRNIRERIGTYLAKRIITEYQHELGAWMLRANAGWEEVVRLRAVEQERQVKELRAVRAVLAADPETRPA